MDAALHHALLVRCRWSCECGCGAKLPPGEVDHFFGRAKADESEATCWVLSVQCHYAKTRNSPSNADWQRRFIAHCTRLIDARPEGALVVFVLNDERHAAYQRLLEAKHRAEARLDFVEARGTLGAALAVRR